MYVLVGAGVLLWAGVTLILDDWWRRAGDDGLTDRLRPYQPPSLADEAEIRLRQQP